MLIRRLDITDVRNLKHIELVELSKVNVFYGVNGAGKTSLLESINFLSSARSFRSYKLAPVINSESSSCVIFGEVNIPGAGYQPIGVERFRQKNCTSNIKISGKTVNSASVLAESLPLQVMNADTFKLLEGSPLVRRQFMDWGVFHVEHNFHNTWKATQRCLKQRNILLRNEKTDAKQLSTWTAELVRNGEKLDVFRSLYFDKFIPIFEKTLNDLCDISGLKISYYRGWDINRSLIDIYSENNFKEKEQGFTTVGPHRADIKLRYHSQQATDILSRGQQKLVVCALRIAQGYLLSELTNRQCVFLLDDLPSELDKKHRKKLCKLLEDLGSQIFLTCINHEDMTGCWSDKTDIKMFHVEQGKISLAN